MSVNLECILCRTGSGICSRKSIPEKRNKIRVREELWTGTVWSCRWFGQRRRSLHRAHSDPTHLPLRRGTCHSCSSSAERQQRSAGIKAELPGNCAAKERGVVSIKNKVIICARQRTSALFDLNSRCSLPDRRRNNLPHRWSKLRTGSRDGIGRRPPRLCLPLLPLLHRHPQTHLHIK